MCFSITISTLYKPLYLTVLARRQAYATTSPMETRTIFVEDNPKGECICPTKRVTSGPSWPIKCYRKRSMVTNSSRPHITHMGNNPSVSLRRFHDSKNEVLPLNNLTSQTRSVRDYPVDIIPFVVLYPLDSLWIRSLMDGTKPISEAIL